MTRYQALRQAGCDCLTAGIISFMNSVQGVPDGYAGILNVVIEYEKE